MYNSTFVNQNYGYGSALAIIIVIFCVISTLLARFISKALKVE
jgi:multiple sugar transport system permease protein/raffinose/stachyose/melibiose transport system permease protein